MIYPKDFELNWRKDAMQIKDQSYQSYKSS
jgi:hypothetical protein